MRRHQENETRKRYQRNPEKGIKLINILITLFNYFNGAGGPQIEQQPTNQQKEKLRKKID